MGGTTHGLRTSFRSWAAESGVPGEVAEAALGHVVPGVDGSYQRSHLLEARRTVIEDWANYLTQGSQCVEAGSSPSSATGLRRDGKTVIQPEASVGCQPDWEPRVRSVESSCWLGPLSSLGGPRRLGLHGSLGGVHQLAPHGSAPARSGPDCSEAHVNSRRTTRSEAHANSRP